MQERIGVYIHIPFCVQKCPYCNFYSIKQSDEVMDEYERALIKQIKQFFCNHPETIVDSIYFGGGTPILMKERLCRILEALMESAAFDNAEISLEANPFSTIEDLLFTLNQSGFNRISFGVQSGIDQELRALGRTHSVSQAKKALEQAASAGFSNLSADLMMGIPYQDEDSLAASIDFLTDSPIKHLSAYLLKIEEGTPFTKSKLRAYCADDDMQASLYEGAVNRLLQKGFLQYEISNFAKPGWECRHNIKYWNCEDYIGFGPSAHSLFHQERFYIADDLKTYLFQAKEGRFSYLPEGKGGDLEEYLLLRLRLSEGVLFEDLLQRYPDAKIDGIIRRAKDLQSHSLTEVDQKGIRLTVKGFLVSNSIILHLLEGLQLES